MTGLIINGLCCFFVGIVLTVIAGKYYEKGEGTGAGIGVLIVALLFFIVSIICFSKIGYRNGQIDCLNGKVYYEIVKQDNSEDIWMEKK